MSTSNVPVAAVNARIIEGLEKGDVKYAQDSTQDMIRRGIREEAFSFNLLPPEKATNDMLVPDLDERLRILCELEPDGPGAKWVALQEIPDSHYIVGSKFWIPLARVLTDKMYKDLAELRTYKNDLRKLFTDLSIKEGLAKIDAKFIETINSIVFDASGPAVANNQTGKVQWIRTSEGLNRSSFAEACKMLPRGNSSGQYRLRNHVALMNDATAQDWLKLGRDDVGGDLAEDMFKNGLTRTEILGMKMLFTIKDDLVPDNHVYFFAAPEFLGKCYYSDDWTTYMKQEAYFIEWFSMWMGGMGIGNVAGAAVCQFNNAT
jgi:hypothetical protein